MRELRERARRKMDGPDGTNEFILQQKEQQHEEARRKIRTFIKSIQHVKAVADKKKRILAFSEEYLRYPLDATERDIQYLLTGRRDDKVCLSCLLLYRIAIRNKKETKRVRGSRSMGEVRETHARTHRCQVKGLMETCGEIAKSTRKLRKSSSAALQLMFRLVFHEVNPYSKKFLSVLGKLDLAHLKSMRLGMHVLSNDEEDTSTVFQFINIIDFDTSVEYGSYHRAPPPLANP